MCTKLRKPSCHKTSYEGARSVVNIQRWKLLIDFILQPHLSWWRHQMETYSALLTHCAGNSPGNSLHKGQWGGALMFSLICTWTNGWSNNRDAGDLRRIRAHYEVTVMKESNEWMIHSLDSFRCGCNMKSIISNLLSRLNTWSISFEIVFRWIPQSLTDD